MNLTGENVFYSVIIEKRKTQLIKIFTVKIQTACVVFFSRAFFYRSKDILQTKIKMYCENVKDSKIMSKYHKWWKHVRGIYHVLS